MKIAKLFDFYGKGIDVCVWVCFEWVVCVYVCERVYAIAPALAQRRLFRLGYFQKQTWVLSSHYCPMKDCENHWTMGQERKLALGFTVRCGLKINPPDLGKWILAAVC